MRADARPLFIMVGDGKTKDSSADTKKAAGTLQKVPYGQSRAVGEEINQGQRVTIHQPGNFISQFSIRDMYFLKQLNKMESNGM
jgi:hypothetical protein